MSALGGGGGLFSGIGAGATQLIALLNNLLIQVGAINQTLKAVFPQTIGTATTATGGAATLPANPVGFLDVVNPATGATVKIPYYSP